MRIICNLCPHLCDLDDGQVGKCNVRQRFGSDIKLTGYGKLSNMAVEPIEKRPFFHFYPGSKFLSVGMYGCNLSCSFCQNFNVSQVGFGKSLYYSPLELIKLAQDKNVKGIAFTYNEPTIYYEYLIDLGMENPGLKLALKSNGYAAKCLVEDLSQHYQAWNVDIKGDEDEYEKVCGSTLQPVLDTIELLSSLDTHLEISYLVLPRQVDDFKYHSKMRDWLFELSPNIPIHLLYFYPCYNMKDGQYGEDKLIKIYEHFSDKMRYVYMSNIFRDNLMKYRNTYCRDCNSVVVNRGRELKINKEYCCSGNSIIF